MIWSQKREGSENAPSRNFIEIFPIKGMNSAGSTKRICFLLINSFNNPLLGFWYFGVYDIFVKSIEFLKWRQTIYPAAGPWTLTRVLSGNYSLYVIMWAPSLSKFFKVQILSFLAALSLIVVITTSFLILHLSITMLIFGDKPWENKITLIWSMFY